MTDTPQQASLVHVNYLPVVAMVSLEVMLMKWQDPTALVATTFVSATTMGICMAFSAAAERQDAPCGYRMTGFWYGVSCCYTFARVLNVIMYQLMQFPQHVCS